MSDQVALFDMDGTLFDYHEALKRDMLKIASTEDLPIFHSVDYDFFALESRRYYRERISMITRQKGWWRDLEPIVLMHDLYRLAEEIGFFCKILTKGPKTKPDAWTEKVECIHKHFGTDAAIDIVGHDKSGTYGRVLFDDYPAYLKGWLKHRPRGLAIMPVNQFNKDFTHENVIHYDFKPETFEKIRSALHAAYNRESGQHWRELLK